MKPSIAMLAVVGAWLLLGNGCKSLPEPTHVEAQHSQSRTTAVETGQHPQSMEREITITTHANYLLYIPEGYADSQKKWPLILFLHGAGERGNDLTKVAVHGPPKLIAAENKALPFIIVSPQCPERDWWSSGYQIASLNALLDDIIEHYRVDEDRIYLTGLSMGGFGSWALATASPDRFAAIAPICGGGNPDDAVRIAHIPEWVFHGARDNVVAAARSEEMVAALEKAGADVTFTVYPDAGHDSWTETYNNPDLFEWFLRHTRSRAK